MIDRLKTIKVCVYCGKTFNQCGCTEPKYIEVPKVVTKEKK